MLASVSLNHRPLSSSYHSLKGFVTQKIGEETLILISTSKKIVHLEFVIVSSPV